MVPTRVARACLPPARVASHAADPTDGVQEPREATNSRRKMVEHCADHASQELGHAHDAHRPRGELASVVIGRTNALRPQRRRARRLPGVLGQLRSSRAARDLNGARGRCDHDGRSLRAPEVVSEELGSSARSCPLARSFAHGRRSAQELERARSPQSASKIPTDKLLANRCSSRIQLQSLIPVSAALQPYSLVEQVPRPRAANSSE